MESPMKAIIELSSKKSIFRAVKQQVAEAQKEGKSMVLYLKKVADRDGRGYQKPRRSLGRHTSLNC
jgi:hypothetical protein